jgi:hypothetical protein
VCDKGVGADGGGSVLSVQPLPWPGSISQQPPLPGLAELEVLPGSLPSLAKCLEVVPEHRRPRGFRADQPPVPLIPSLLLLLVALLCGRRGYQPMADFGRLCAQEEEAEREDAGCKEPGLLDILGFPGSRSPRTPAAATFFRLVRGLDLRSFQQALEGWIVELASALHLTLPAWERAAIPEEQVALDGKTVRGATAGQEGPGENRIVHAVAAYLPALQAIVGQVVTEGKGKELATAQLLLGQLDLRGRLVTADAHFTQREFCKEVLERGGDYLLPVKGNQPSLLADIKEAFSPVAAEQASRRLAELRPTLF